MNIFISGATGYIGSRLAMQLAQSGHTIHALYRDERKAAVIKHQNIRLFRGDILDLSSLAEAMYGCDQAYHTAAYAKVWQKDYMQIYRQNVEGSVKVVKAAINCGVRRIVCTSTGGVLGPSLNGDACSETTKLPDSYFIDYECSKRIMEESLMALSGNGTDIIIVSPTRVYGPGVLSDSNGVTRIIQKYRKGNWRIIPGNGKSVGNYVYIDDVVTGHISAMEKGRPGDKYILGGEDIDYDGFFRQLAEVTGQKHYMIHIPVPLSEFIASMLLLIARLSGTSPLITPALVRKYYHNWSVSSNKAKQELNYQPIDFKSGAVKTVEWLNTMNL
ncbi:MAG TPA: NAD-dependent epimerase/dehydratase family protein [Lentimicrobium sp.]|nr:NAD-dependent epimerase/dehydratase family protein [Lentimicrobium sp.]